MWEALIDRQEGFRLFSRDVLEKVRDCKVLMIGCGGNGAVADLLVRAGFTRFGLIDDDSVEDTNLNRLPFSTAEVGLPKVEAWRSHILSVNPDASVQGWKKALCRFDADWLRAVLRGEAWEADRDPVDLIFLGTTDAEANLLVGRIAAEEHVRTIIGPASSGSWVVGTFVHGEGDVTMESLGGFGTEGTALEDIDYAALRMKYVKALNYPGRADKLLPGIGAAMMKGELAARSCGIFVRMTNAAMAFEAVKNVAEMNGLPVDGTSVVRLPQVQIFNPYTGCSYYYDIQRQAVGFPDWRGSDIRWESWEGAPGSAPVTGRHAG